MAKSTLHVELLAFLCVVLITWDLDGTPLQGAQNRDDVAVNAVGGHSWKSLLLDQIGTDASGIQLCFPPLNESLLGAVVAINEQGQITVVDRMDAAFDEPTERPVETPSLVDIRQVPPDNPLFEVLVGPDVRSTEPLIVRVEAMTMRSKTVAESNRDDLQKAIMNSRKALNVFNREQRPAAVMRTFEGILRFSIQLPNAAEAAKTRTQMDGFSQSIDAENVTLTSNNLVTFAFEPKEIHFKFDPTLNNVPANVSLTTPTTAYSATAWEHLGAAYGSGVPLESGHTVTVPYATCRALQSPSVTRGQAFLGFFSTWYGIFALIVVVLLGLIGWWLVPSPWRKYAIIVPFIVLIACAWMDADRIKLLAKIPEGRFGSERGTLRYGLCTVSVPERHKRGNLETPFAFFVLRLPDDPEKHFVVQDLEEGRTSFSREVRERVENSTDREAFVFIHGYNVDFGTAVKRTAQLAVDLQFPGAPICFTWPSKAELIHYLQDTTTGEAAAIHLKDLLLDLEANSGAKQIHIIAHSMGNDVLTRALRSIGQDHLAAEECKFREILLAAPDIDKEVFEKEIAPAITNKVQHVTVYASSNDAALQKSYEVRGYPRVGMAGEDLTVCEGIDTVDVSELDTDFLGHSYYGDHILVVTDLFHVLRNHHSPRDRGLLQRETKQKRTYWQFPK